MRPMSRGGTATVCRSSGSSRRSIARRTSLRTTCTLPGNRAIAFSPELDYVVLRVERAAEGRRARPGETLLVAAALAEEMVKRAGIEAYSVIDTFPGESLAGTIASHPLRGQGY